MYEPIQFEPAVEALVRFVEETSPDKLVSATLDKLRAGALPTELVRAAALAVIRSTELPASHHGGAVHPISGLHGCLHAAKRLSGEMSFLPIVQHVAVCNHHIHSPHMGPYIMPDLTPRDGSVDDAYEVFHDSESSVVHIGTASTSSSDKTRLDSTVAAFMNNVHSRRPVAAEQCLLWLLEHQTPGEVLDHLLPLCVSRNHMDDHNFLYPVLSAMALEDIGWDWARVLLRPVVRYHARQPSNITIDPEFKPTLIDEAMAAHGLLDKKLAVKTNAAESDQIESLANAIASGRKFADGIGLSAQALAEGLSLEGVGEALSIAASRVFVSTTYGNPMDSHLHTGATTRRFLVRLPGVSQRTRVSALLSGLTGPECTCSEELMVAQPPAPTAVPAGGPEQLAEAIVECIEGQPIVDWRATLRIDELSAPQAAWDAMALAHAYLERGGGAQRLFDKLAEFVSRDDFTELHSIKQHQAIVDEYNTTRESLRDMHVIAAVKSAACVRSGKEQTVYEQLQPLLH